MEFDVPSVSGVLPNTPKITDAEILAQLRSTIEKLQTLFFLNQKPNIHTNVIIAQTWSLQKYNVEYLVITPFTSFISLSVSL